MSKHAVLQSDVSGLREGGHKALPTGHFVIITVLIMLLGGLFAWWMVERADSRMRADLLSQTRLLAQAVNIDHVSALTGTKSDLGRPEYLRLKDQLGAARLANPQCRFIYLLGRNADGKLYFYVDSEPADSQDYSPPGQIYDEATDSYREAFATSTAAVVGPATDRWGTWVSALVPLQEHQTARQGLATPDAAKAMVQKAVDYYRKNGRARLLQEINNPRGEFQQGDLYVFAYDRNMTMQAHPVKPELVGENQLDKKDWVGGKYFRKEIQKVALTKGSGWVDYEYENPVSKIIEPKTTYLELVDDLIICAGSYKGNVAVRALLVMDVDARNWHVRLLPAALPAILLALMLCAILWSGRILLRRRFRLVATQPRPMRYLEPALAIAAGFTLTLFFAWMLSANDLRNRKETFDQLAASRTEAIAKTLVTLRDTEMEGLARFLEGNANPTSGKFRQYSTYLTKNQAISAWEWIPVLPAADKARFTSTARAAGLTGFEIWQKDAQGKRIQATGRALYYPVFRVAPQVGNEKALGYDLGSDEVRHAALALATQTRLPTASDPVTLVQETGSQKGMLIYRPVFGDTTKNPRGFALAVMRMGSLLQSGHPDKTVLMDIALLRKDGPPEKLAASWDADSPPATGIFVTRTVFAFGKTFAVTAHAGPEFTQAHPLTTGLLTLLIGLLLTAFFAALLHLSRSRRVELELLVAGQTIELRESENFQRMLLSNLPAGIVIVDPVTRIIEQVNIAAANMFGAPTENIVGKRCHSFLCPASEGSCPICDLGKEVDNEEKVMLCANGSVRPVLKSVKKLNLQRQEKLLECFVDITDRKQAEDALKSSEENFRTFFGSIADLLFVLDGNGNMIDVNDTVIRRLEYTKEELIGQSVLFVHPEARREEAGATVAAMLAGTKDFCPVPVISKSGVEIQVETRVYPGIWDGKPALFGVVKDVTSMKQSEEKFARAFQSGSNLMAISTVKTGLYIDVNEMFLRALEYSRDEVIGKTSKDLELFDDYTQRDLIKTSMSERGFANDIEVKIKTKTGRIIFGLFSASLINIGEEQCWLTTMTDITERKKAEESLEHLSTRLTLATRAGGVGVWDYDTVNNILVWDEQMFQLYGITEDQLSGAYEAWRAGIHPDDLERGDAEIQLALRGEKEFDTEFRVVWPDGTIHNIRALAIVKRDETGKPLQMVGTNWDITAQKQAEQVLLDTNLDLQEAIVKADMANMAKSEFLANMSHELRTPMNGVIGMNSLLLDTELTDEQHRYAETVRASGESLLALLNDILDFSKIEAKKLDLEIMDFDLRVLLDDFAAVQALRAHEKGLEFICSAAPDVPTLLRGDPGRLRQILVNLAGNAVKFTHQGEIAVRASVLLATDDDVIVRFSIKDTGIGIPADKQNMLFQKFTQVDASVTRKFGGTGLGLAISKQLSEIMGGEIGIISPSTLLRASPSDSTGSPQAGLRAGEAGQGSEFWFTARFGRQAQNERKATQLSDISGMRILVVDDNTTNREVLLTQLASWGVVAGEAADGLEALAALHAAKDAGNPFVGAILDMQMPGMNGAELAVSIKADDTIQDTRLILMTSMTQRGDAKRMEEIGFAAYLTKPARQSDLYSCLAVVLSGESLAQAPKPLVTRHTIREMNLGVVRILLAEDNVINQQVAAGILKKLGLRADTVANGNEAIAALKMIPYDLVLMDCMMPEMDGYEATQAIRNPQSAVLNHKIPIIAMTANAMQGDRERCLAAGMNDYVSKPVDAKALAEALEKWLPKEENKDEYPMMNTLKGIFDKEYPTDEGINGLSPAGGGLGVDGKTVGRVSKTRRARTVRGTVPTHRKPDVPVFDLAGMMDRLMGDEPLVRMLIEGFLDDIPKQIDALRGFLAAGDVKSTERQVHTIKGASANMGGEALRALAFEMEKEAKAGNLEYVKAHLPDLETQFDRLNKEMKKYTNK